MVGTFPLNVQAGSPQYTLASDITPASSTTLITISYTDPIEPITNAYYTIQNEDGSKWCTFYVSNWRVGDSPMTYYLSCTYSSSNTSDVFPEGSICWCIWCKEYYDSLIAKIGGGGNTVKVSQLEWDTNLVIPDGKAIESASGEVGIVGDVSISGSVSASGNLGTDGSISGGGDITTAGNLVGINAVLSDKPLVIGKNVGNASVTLSQIPTNISPYTSPDYTINDAIANVQYVVPPITHQVGSSNGFKSTFIIQAKLSNGTYQTLSSVSLDKGGAGTRSGATKAALTPHNTVALRYVVSVIGSPVGKNVISSDLTLSLTPNPVY